MNIRINKNSMTPLYVQIANGIRNLIREEELTDNYKLPSERQLAKELGVHRNTVVRAYNELVADGFIVTSRVSPKGYFVLRNRQEEKKRVFFPLAKMIRYNFTANEKLFEQIFDESSSFEYISMAGIVMGKAINPIVRMSDIFDRMKAGYWSRNIEKLQDNETERLKYNICNLLKSRNMYINKKNIQIVSETTQALSHIIDLYLTEGDCIIVEEPVVPDTVNLFRNKNIKVACVSMEEDGPNLKEMERLIVEKSPKFLYVMPNYHNPTGIVMSLQKRMALLELSYKYGIPIIEEDSQNDFNYSSRRIPTLYSLDRYKSVLYIDTFTLTFLPGIKTAFVVGPYEPIEMIGSYIKMSQVFISNIGQYMLNEFIETGNYEEHLKDLREYYETKRDVLMRALKRIEHKGLSAVHPEGGLYVWCTLDSRINEKELFQLCRQEGLLLMPGYIFYPNGYQGGGHIRLCFSNVSDQEIEEAVLILERALDHEANRQQKEIENE